LGSVLFIELINWMIMNLCSLSLKVDILNRKRGVWIVVLDRARKIELLVM